MNKHLQKNIFAVMLILLSSIAWKSALANVVIGPGSVTVIEDLTRVSAGGQFTVTNNSAAPIYAFAVGNNDALQAFGRGFARFRHLIPASEINDVWGASVITRQTWEANNRIDGFGEDANGAWTVPDTSTLVWDDLFGSEFNKIITYWVVGEGAQLLDLNLPGGATSIPIGSGQTQSHFFFETTQAFSPFVAFGENGTVIASGETTVVPIPATIWLFGSALFGLFQISRRK